MINIAIGSILLCIIWLHMWSLIKKSNTRMVINWTTMQTANKLYTAYALPFAYTKAAKHIMVAYSRSKIDQITGYVLIAFSTWPILAYGDLVRPIDTLTSMVICVLVATWITRVRMVDMTPREAYWNAFLSLLQAKKERTRILRDLERLIPEEDTPVTQAKKKQLTDALDFYDQRIELNMRIVETMSTSYNPNDEDSDDSSGGGFSGMTPA